ncbi:MAG: efflux RND transporter periplasmic adaptor subunit [Proteobacteria bacterium]|nr:efflux RND transporter periplasmic adaptor subunit [Pseudomonadota bacterium]
MSKQLPPIETLQSTEQSNKVKPVLLVFLVLSVTAVLAFVMFMLMPNEQKKENIKIIPAVEVIQIQPIDYVVPIKSEGVALPKTQINLAAEVSGKINFVADGFINGGTFSQGDVLLKIDPRDYELAITRAKANVAAQLASLDLEQAKSDLAKNDWEKYGKKGKANALNLNLPQVASAKAALDGAKADLQLAKRNLEKTHITAPFSGVILNKMVDFGQFVGVGTSLVNVASTEIIQIRLSLSDQQLHNSDLDKFDGSQNISVKITSEELPNTHWLGKIVSIEAARDVQTLFNYVIVEINQPFTQQNTPLRFNTFVNATLNGITLYQVYPVERGNIMPGDKVKLLSPQSLLAHKKVEVIYADSEYKYISKGIDSDDRIITTGLSHIKVGDKLKLSE